MTRSRAATPQTLFQGRVAGIDYGRRRIGVAICDSARIIASPRCVRETTGDHAADAAFFQSLVREEELTGFVVGLPLHADGTTSEMSREAERFGAWLARATGLPVAYHDERFTSHEAAEMLPGVGLSRGQKKRQSDAVAAQVILRSWMEADAAAQTARRPLRLVVGCGYLGTRVARLWSDRGDRVIGTTRSPERAAEISAHGIEAAIIDVTAAGPGWERLFEAAGYPDTVFWSVAFDRAGSASYRDVHVAGLQRLLDALARHDSVSPRVIFASSTGVWGDEQGGVVDESTPPAPSREAGRVLLEAEQLLASRMPGNATALRFAGLYGPGRLPRLANLLAGQPIAANPESWLNLIHVDDAAAIVVAMASVAGLKPVYIVSDGKPVRRREWYGRLADIAGASPPAWDTSAPRNRGGDKRVDPARLFADCKITLSHPDALTSLPALVNQLTAQ